MIFPTGFRTMIFCRTFAAALSVVLAVGQSSFAGYSLRWDATTPTTSTGAPINVNLYLEQTASDTTISQFGVSGATYIVNRTGSGIIGTVAPNNLFEGPGPGGTPTAITDGNSAQVVQTSILGLPDPSGSVQIGSFSIHAMAPGLGQLVVDLLGGTDDISVYTDNMFSQLGLTNLNLSSPTFNYNFTAVPEPTSIGGIGMIACLRVWCRRKRKVTSAEANRWNLWRTSQRRRKIATSSKYCRRTGSWS